MRVLGVTGTNGKTTTTYLLDAIARRAGDRVGVIGTVGARVAGESIAIAHTTPEASDLQALLARMRDAGAATVAMEVSSHALEQHRVDGVQFAAVCFTNLSHEHLDYHGTLDAYFAAKARLFTPEFARAAAVNLDDARGDELAARARDAGLDVITYAIDDDARRPARGRRRARGRRHARARSSIARTGRRLRRSASRSSVGSTSPTPSPRPPPPLPRAVSRGRRWRRG